MKNNFLVLPLVLMLCSCQSGQETIQQTSGGAFYERSYALPAEAREWAKHAPLADLCQGTKNWRHPHIREASVNEIKSRNIDTRACYYTGMELTP